MAEQARTPGRADATSSPAAGRSGTGTTRRIWELAWPAILTNLFQSLTGIWSFRVIGHELGSEAVSAIGVGHRVFFLGQVVLMAVTAGTTALVARAWGAGRREEAERVTRTSLWLSIAIGLILTVPAIGFARPLIGLFPLQGETAELAAIFLRWMAAGTVFLGVNLVFGTALRAAGDTITPLWIGALTMIVNLVSLYAFVFGWFGITPMGIHGAAASGVVAFVFGALLSVGLWLRGRLVIGVGPRGGDFAGERIRQLVRIGLPAGAEQAFFQSGFLIFVVIVVAYGDAANSAYQIGVQILSVSFLIGFGFSIAASTLVGQHLGAEDPAGAVRSGWRAMWLSIAFMTVFGAAIVAFAEPLARFMIDDDEVVRLTVIFIWVLGAVQPLMAIEFTLGGALRGAGDTRFPLYTVLAGMVGVRLTTATAVWQLGGPIEWVYGSLIADYIVKAVMLTLRFRSGRWKTVLANAS